MAPSSHIGTRHGAMPGAVFEYPGGQLSPWISFAMQGTDAVDHGEDLSGPGPRDTVVSCGEKLIFPQLVKSLNASI